MKTARALQPDPVKVLTQATLRAAAQLSLGSSDLAKVIGTSPSTISRLSSGSKLIDPNSKEGEMALLLVRLYRSLDAMVGNDSQLRLDWMRAHNRVFKTIPHNFIQCAKGLVTAVNYIEWDGYFHRSHAFRGGLKATVAKTKALNVCNSAHSFAV